MTKVKRLTLEYTEGPNKEVRYNIWNDKEQFLGFIAKKRVGSYMHWCFFPEVVDEIGDLWFSAGCVDEIREFMKNPEKHVTMNYIQ